MDKYKKWFYVQFRLLWYERQTTFLNNYYTGIDLELFKKKWEKIENNHNTISLRKIIYTTRDKILSNYVEEHQQDEDIQNEINIIINDIRSKILNKKDIKYKKSFKKNKGFKKITKNKFYVLSSYTLDHFLLLQGVQKIDLW